MNTEESLPAQGTPLEGRPSGNWMRENSGTAVGLLVAAHVVSGIVFAVFSADKPAASSALLLSLMFCQTSLLGMWCGLGGSHWILRLIGMIVGTGYLTTVLGAGINEMSEETFFLVAVAVLLVAAVTWLVRRLKGAMQQIHGSAPDAREGLQFTIRHLLVLTFVIACLVTIGKALAPRLSGIHDISIMSVIAVCFVCVALVAIWAMLGLGHVAFRSILPFVIATITGWILARVIDNSDHIFWISTTILQATYLIGSLFVIRSCGYRFLARPRSD